MNISQIMKKRIFIIGGSILQLPAILKAKEMNLYVGVADFNPQAIGISYADEYFNVSTIDEIEIYKSAKAFNANCIMTLATDKPMRSVAYTCSKLGLPGISYDTAIKSTDKGEMIKAFENHGVEHPWFYIIKNAKDLEKILDKVTYPCISKPTDNSGSSGVMFANSENKLIEAVRYSSEKAYKGSVIIEEYMNGNEVSVEVIVYKGIPRVLAVTDKLTTGAPHFVEMGHSQPSCIDKISIKKIENLACRAVQAVGIENGPAHVEIILTKDGPKMVELGARLGGDCITTHLVKFSTGIDMVKATIQIALGEKPEIEKEYQKGSAIRYFSVPKGVIKKIEGVEEAKKMDGIMEITFVKNVGDVVCDINSSKDRIGFVIAQGNNATDAISRCSKAEKLIKICL